MMKERLKRNGRSCWMKLAFMKNWINPQTEKWTQRKPVGFCFSFVQMMMTMLRWMDRWLRLDSKWMLLFENIWRFVFLHSKKFLNIHNYLLKIIFLSKFLQKNRIPSSSFYSAMRFYFFFLSLTHATLVLVRALQRF